MKTYLLAWNPKRSQWTDLADLSRKTKLGVQPMTSSTCGNTKSIQQGDRVFWIRLGVEPKGIFGCGTVTRGSYVDQHWDSTRPRETAIWVDIRVDSVFHPDCEPIVPRAELDRPPLSQMHWDTQVSGIQIPDEVAAELEQLWLSFTSQGGGTLPEDLAEDAVLYEGAGCRVLVNAYERSRAAREQCLAHHGASCAVCGFDFGQRFGELAQGFIHVHHLVPLSELGERYQINPIRDLIPVCPNCHAAIHMREPPHSVAEVQSALKQQGRPSTG
jgi:5-methylcytosine-specific restriction protein A